MPERQRFETHERELGSAVPTLGFLSFKEQSTICSTKVESKKAYEGSRAGCDAFGDNDRIWIIRSIQ